MLTWPCTHCHLPITMDANGRWVTANGDHEVCLESPDSDGHYPSC